MVATVINPEADYAAADAAGLAAYMRLLAGREFLFARQAYAGELTLHFSPAIPNHPKLKQPTRGAFVLACRRSDWVITDPAVAGVYLSEPYDGLPPADLATASLADLPALGPIPAGAVVVAFDPIPTATGFGCRLTFTGGAHMGILPAPGGGVADWELFTPYDRVLRAGPGPAWSYGAARG